MDEHNPAFTGFLSNGLKRIDLVLVLEDEGSVVEEMRIDFLKRIIKFGLELELDEGKMSGHKNLIFAKLHAPETIIEEYGLYFNERKLFKDSHVDRIKPFLYSFGIRHEIELVKRIQEQYPRPANYSTLERSRIVYNIIHRLPFGIQENFIGINKLLELKIILDVYALHDGPYFLASGQKTCYNSRQMLFYNWIGITNVWRSQPVHLIQEYLGERIAMYFAYYEHFNFMLMFPAIFGFFIFRIHYYGEPRKLDNLERNLCNAVGQYICPVCRHFDICPMRNAPTYCREIVTILNTIDTPYMQRFAFFISIWGIIFVVLWNRKQYYLIWLWEVKEKYINKIIISEHSQQQFEKSQLTGVVLEKFNLKATFKWWLQIFLSLVLFGVWLLGMFIIAIQIWYVKHWLDKIYNVLHFGLPYMTDIMNYNEYLFIGIGAGVYSIVTTPLKALAKLLSYKLTALENIKTIGTYSCSLALKLYGFYLSGTFALLTLHLFVGNLFYTHLLDMKNWYSIGGFKVMNNGLGSSLDDMCVTLAIAVIMEQIIVKIPLYFKWKSTDYEMIDINIPVWEREYRLDSFNDEHIHYEYNDIAIKFAMATLFSLTFPLAPLLILLINVWDIRHKARNLLLAYRRPLLIDTSGPAIWHDLIIITSYLVPIFNVLTIALQSRYFLIHRAFKPRNVNHDDVFLPQWDSDIFRLFKGPGSPNDEYKKLPSPPLYCSNAIYDHWFPRGRKKFVQEYQALHVFYYRIQYILLYSTAGVLINLFIHIKFPTKTRDIEDAINTEWRIKQKYYIKKGILPKDEY